MINTVGGRSGHAPVLRRPLEALVSKSADLVAWSAKVTLSIAAASAKTTVAIGSAVTDAATSILGLAATKGTFRPTAAKTSGIVSEATGKAAPASPRIPLTAVVPVATSSSPSTTWSRITENKKTQQGKSQFLSITLI